MILRNYQREAIDSIYRYYEQYDGNILTVLPTGSGKSLVMATFIREVLETWPDQTILMLTHVKELIEQNEKELLNLWPQAPVGVYSAGLGRREAGNGIFAQSITIAGIQSVYKKSDELGAFDLILIDEAHTVPPDGEGMYRQFLDDQLTLNPQVKVIGLTATPYRMKQGLLTEGKGKLFDDIAYDKNVGALVAEGYLAPLITRGGIVKADISNVNIRGGEYVTGQLAEACDNEELTSGAVDEVCRLAADRKSWLVFCVTVDHAAHVRDAFQKRGISCEMIHGGTPADERSVTLDRFKIQDIKCVTNVGVLTTGFNHPALDCLVMLRPTKSTGLYVQMLGRGMRNAPGKSECLILDYAGNVLEHGPIDGITVKKCNKSGQAEVKKAPSKECPECRLIIPAGKRECPECGHIWPTRNAETANSAADLPVMKTIQQFIVDDVSYHCHEKIGSPASLRVEYHCGLNRFKEWVCLEHAGYARSKALYWWLEQMPGISAPLTITGALDKISNNPPAIPATITISFKSKYPEIMRKTYDAHKIAA